MEDPSTRPGTNEITLKNVEDFEAYSGPHAIEGIRFKHARQALGVSAWGMNVLEFEPNCSGYPRHDHAADGQEEVYVVLQGRIVLQAGGSERELEQGDFVRVPPELERKFVTRTQGATLLALGATPGKAFTPSM